MPSANQDRPLEAQHAELALAPVEPDPEERRTLWALGMLTSSGRTAWSPRQLQRLFFIRWLYVTGRLSS